MTSPIAKARRRPMMAPILPPVIISDAITSVYRVIAVWMPVTVVPMSAATWRIETFMTELSRVIKNWPAASTPRTNPLPATRPGELVPLVIGVALVTGRDYGLRHPSGEASPGPGLATSLRPSAMVGPCAPSP